MSFTGDLSQLDAMAARLGELATIPSRASKDAASRIEELMQDEFDRGIDPYEEPWAPLKASTVARGRSAPPLTDTSEMRDSLRVKPLSGAGVGATIEHPAGVHQTGSRTMAARPILPARGELPDGWIEAIEQSCEKAFRGVVRK